MLNGGEINGQYNGETEVHLAYGYKSFKNFWNFQGNETYVLDGGKTMKKFPKGLWKKILKGKKLGAYDTTKRLSKAKHVEHEE